MLGLNVWRNLNRLRGPLRIPRRLIRLFGLRPAYPELMHPRSQGTRVEAQDRCGPTFPSMRQRVSERILRTWLRSISSKVLVLDEKGREGFLQGKGCSCGFLKKLEGGNRLSIKLADIYRKSNIEWLFGLHFSVEKVRFFRYIICKWDWLGLIVSYIGKALLQIRKAAGR